MEITGNERVDEILTILTISGLLPQMLAVALIAMIVKHPIITLLLVTVAVWRAYRCLR